jgi:HEAT repeat protein
VKWLAAGLLATALVGCGAGSRGDLQSFDPRTRAAAVKRLGESRKPGDLAAILVAQQDPDAGVRRAAASAHGSRGGIPSQEGLSAMLRDPDPSVVAAAARALGAIRPDGPGTDAREAAELHRRAALSLTSAYGRADAPGRAQIAAALHEIGGSLRDAVEAEARLLWDQNERGLRGTSEAGRAGAAEELGRSGRADSVKLLVPLLDEARVAPQVMAASARGLGWSGDVAVVEPLEAALASHWADVAEGAAWALGNIGSPAGAESLAEVGSTSPARLAAAAVAALLGMPAAPEVGVALCEVAIRTAHPSVADRAAAGARTREAECPEKPLTLRIARGGPGAEAALAAFGSLGLDGERLRGSGERALALLQSGTDPRLRIAAARALGGAPYAAAVPALQRRAASLQDRGTRAPIAPGGTATVTPSDAEELGEVAVALARLAPESSGTLALRLAVDPEPRLRAHAARALALSRPAGGVETLALLARDGDPAVRLAAVAALGTMGSPGLAPLAAALAAGRGDDEEASATVRAIGATGDPRALPILASMLAGDQAPAAAAAIGRLGAAGGASFLLAALERGQASGRVEVIDALGLLGSPEAGEPITRELTSDRPEVRSAAARALGRLRYEGSASRLEALRADYYADVRRGAVEALARLPTRTPPRR